MTEKKVEGVGLCLRFPHFPFILEKRPNVPWFEVLVENFFTPGEHHEFLEELARHYPLVFHSVGMNLGSADALDKNYFKTYQKLKEKFKPRMLSDHLCWSAICGRSHHDLLPLPYTKKVVEQVSLKIKMIQDLLGERLLVENLSDYIRFEESEISEWRFLNLIGEKTDCSFLLDINNVFVNSSNHHLDPFEFIDNFDLARVKQFHLAGHENFGEVLLDTHGSEVPGTVLDLYEYTIKKTGEVPTLIEWDKDLPSFEELYKEKEKVESRLKKGIYDSQRLPRAY
jgi:hypothetical protein